jgi:O-antigen/teichoic acid export membrane protein
VRIATNFGAGVAHSVATMAIGLAVVPFYIRYLGVEAYGLIGFSITLQGLLQLLDLGLSTAISREVARGVAGGGLPKTRDLLHSLASIYWLMALCIGTAFAFAAYPIAAGWLNGGAMGVATLTNVVLMIGLFIACRWPSGLYTGALTGAERLALASLLGTAYAIVANVGAVLVLAFYSPTIEAYFIWQAAAALGYTLAMRAAAWRTLGGRSGATFNGPALKSIARFALGMSGVAATATVFMQLDKVILVKLVSLTDFGYYMLATVAASILYALVRPLFNVMYPRFSALVAAGETEKLGALYRTATGLFTLFWFPGALGLALCAEPLLLLWTGDSEIAARAAPLLALLAIGNALHGVMYFPYALQLAYGLSRLPLQINVLLMVFQLPLIVILATTFGAVGAALAWMVLHLFYIALGTWLTHRRLLPGLGTAWLARDVAVPLAVSAAIGFGCVQVQALAFESVAIQLVVGGGAALLAMLLSAALSPYTRANFKAALAA